MFERQEKNHYFRKVFLYAEYNLCSDKGNRLGRLTIQWSPSLATFILQNTTSNWELNSTNVKPM